MPWMLDALGCLHVPRPHTEGCIVRAGDALAKLALMPTGLFFFWAVGRPALYRIQASVKLNVLMWHIVDGQSFPLQSKLCVKNGGNVHANETNLHCHVGRAWLPSSRRVSSHHAPHPVNVPRTDRNRIERRPSWPLYKNRWHAFIHSFTTTRKVPTAVGRGGVLRRVRVHPGRRGIHRGARTHARHPRPARDRRPGQVFP